MKYKIKPKHVLLLIFATMGVVAYFYSGEMKSIAGALQQINVWYMVVAVGCMGIYWLLEARTLHLMLRTFEPDIQYLEVTKLVMATQFFNGITPFSTGGQPFQIYVLAKKNNLHLSSVTCSSVHNFIMYQIVLVMMGFGALIYSRFFSVLPSGMGIGWMMAVGFILNISVIAGLVMIAFMPRLTSLCLKPVYYLLTKVKGGERCRLIKEQVDEKVALFHERIWAIVADPKLFVVSLVLNIIKLLSLYSVTYFLCRTIGVGTISMVQGIVISAYVMLITSVVPIPGATGGAEFGFSMLFGTVIGVHITVIMLLWRFVTYYIGLIIGSIVYYFGYVAE